MLGRLNKLIVILGPTASGKTAWAFKLCEEFNGEIVSADSRQIYKEMDIGTAKNKMQDIRCKMQKKSEIRNQESEIISNIPQHLIDIVKPDQTLTVSEYKKMAIETINNIIRRGKIPFLTGGTGLYISAIVDNLEIPEIKPDWNLRKEFEKKNLKELQSQLKKVDPGSYKEIDLDNKRRLIRAIEASIISGKPFSTLRKKGAPLFDSLQIGIDIPREELNERINKRVDEMKEKGLEREITKLSKKYSWDLPSMSGIGYKEFNIDCRDTINRASTINIFDQIKLHTKQYAKRQMTWFKRDERIIWIKEPEKARKLIANYLNKLCLS